MCAISALAPASHTADLSGRCHARRALCRDSVGGRIPGHEAPDLVGHAAFPFGPGTSQATPISGAGHQAAPAVEQFVLIALVSVAFAMIAGVGMLLFGLRRVA